VLRRRGRKKLPPDFEIKAAPACLKSDHVDAAI
jgi:hypothetical protein